MLTIQVEEQEYYNSKLNVFFYTKPHKVRLEHSLISISKWEARYHKPYLPSGGKMGVGTYEEELYYVECMIIGSAPDYVPELLLQHFSEKIRNYISDPHTATNKYHIGNAPQSTKIVTSELVYYWMIEFGIPSQYDKWHFNRLLTLIDVCNVKKNQANGKNNLSYMEAARHKHQLNKARREAHGNG